MYVIHVTDLVHSLNMLMPHCRSWASVLTSHPLRKTICIRAMDVSVPLLGMDIADMRLLRSPLNSCNFI